MGRSMLYNLSSLYKPNNFGYYLKFNDKNLIKTLEILKETLLKETLNKVNGNACLVIANRSLI